MTKKLPRDDALAVFVSAARRSCMVCGGQNMSPRLSSRVHPQCSLRLEGNAEEKTADYVCLPSPAARPAEDTELPKSSRGNRGLERRWLYNYPRLSFVLLFIVCTYVGGIYVSTKATSWTLDALGIRKELDAAREVYLATSRRLNAMSACVDQSSLEYLAMAKLQFEADSKRVQKVIDANDEILAYQKNATMTCSNAFLSSLKDQVKDSRSDDINTTLSCFSDSFYTNVPETEAVSSSRALVLAVRALLTAQAASEANSSVSKQQNQLESQLREMWNAVDTVKTSIQKTLDATSSLASEQLSSLAPIWSDSDGSGHTEQSASRLGRLSKVVSSEVSNPLTSVSVTSLGALRKAGRTIHKALEFLSGLHVGFTDVMDTVDETWEMLEKQLNATVQQAEQLQKELVYAAESTGQQINSTSAAVMTSIEQAQQEISSLFDILHDKWTNAIKKLVAEGLTPWQRLGDQLVAELTANQRQDVRPESSIQRRYILPDRTTNSSLGHQYARQTNASNDGSTRNSTSSAGNDDTFDIDTAVLRASLVDIGAFITQVIFYVDVGRLTLLVADLAVGLITESYSGMPMLDIRGVTTVDSIGSVCEVFLCQHSFAAVCYALVTKCSEIARVLVTFVLLFVAAAVVTVGLFTWKQDHIAHCGAANVSPTESSLTAVQSITRAFFESSGNKNESVVDPLDEVEKYATIINDSLRNDYAVLKLDAALAWENQSAALDDLNDCASTTSNLVRMLQDCTESASIDALALAADTSSSSQCLTSSFTNSSTPVTPSTAAEQLSENAPFLASATAFPSCFPEEEQLNMSREQVDGKLQHSLACATEKAVYLSFASWWLLIVVFVANRFTMRMIIKAAGVYWWRFLSANRLQFVGFCREDGDIVASNKLPTAIQQHLRQAKWQIAGHFIGIFFAFATTIVVIVTIFHGIA